LARSQLFCEAWNSTKLTSSPRRARGRVVSRLETVLGCRSSSRGSQGRKVWGHPKPRPGSLKAPFSRCRCHITVVDYRWGAMGSDETAGTIPGAPRLILLIAGQRRVLERARQLNPVNPWPRGLPEVAFGCYSTCASAYTARAGASIGRYILSNSLSQMSGQSPSPPSLGSRAFWGAPRTGACGVGDYPTPDLSPRESASRSTSEKSK
jgi:hypothetical protein